jgi:trimethylamine--corrinoid protein Co-methyltransferase
MVKQYMHGLPVNDETLAVDVIDRVGPGHHYLQEDHTFDHFREVWYSQLFDRTINAQWLEQGAVRFEERLREQTRLAMAHRPPPLPEDIIKELDQMEKRWQ